MKRFVLALAALAVAITVCGCGGGSGSGEGGFSSGGEPQVYVVDLCYANKEFLSTEDEELPAIQYYRNHHIFAPEGQQYYVLLDETLRENPFGIESIDTVITDKIVFNSVKVEDGTAYVDIAGENLSGGSLEEGLLISQIVNSLTGSFEEVERVQFLVDGKATDTLMGHYSAKEPYESGIYPVK